jgi:transposase
MMPKRTFTREYKLEVIELARTSGKSKAQLERELGLTPGLIGNWEKALQQDGQQAFPGTGHQTETEAELRRLRRELEIVRQERDILKKAMIVFAKPPDRSDLR